MVLIRRGPRVSTPLSRRNGGGAGGRGFRSMGCSWRHGPRSSTPVSPLPWQRMAGDQKLSGSGWGGDGLEAPWSAGIPAHSDRFGSSPRLSRDLPRQASPRPTHRSESFRIGGAPRERQGTCAPGRPRTRVEPTPSLSRSFERLVSRSLSGRGGDPKLAASRWGGRSHQTAFRHRPSPSQRGMWGSQPCWETGQSPATRSVS